MKFSTIEAMLERLSDHLEIQRAEDEAEKKALSMCFKIYHEYGCYLPEDVEISLFNCLCTLLESEKDHLRMVDKYSELLDEARKSLANEAEADKFANLMKVSVPLTQKQYPKSKKAKPTNPYPIKKQQKSVKGRGL